MSLNNELHDLFGRIEDAPWPGEREAFDRFLQRKRRRGRALAAGATLALAAVVAAAVLVPRLLPNNVEQVVPVAPRGTGMRVTDQGFQLAPPSGWKISRRLLGAQLVPVTDRQPVMGVVLTRRLGTPPGATISVTTGSHEPDWTGASRRPDGRSYQLRPGSPGGDVGQYLVQWPNYCEQSRVGHITCSPVGQPRVLLVTGYAAGGDADVRQQVLQAMQRITVSVQPITSALLPPPRPVVSPQTKVLLGKGGSGTASWEVWIEPYDPRGSTAGFAVHFPQATPEPVRRWEQFEPARLNGQGIYSYLECLSWRRGYGVVVIGLARADADVVQIELSKRPLVEVSVLGRDKSTGMVAFASPPLPAGVLVNRATAFDAEGRMIGTENLQAVAPCRSFG